MARITAACIVGFSLSIADLPHIIPPSLSFMVGVFTGSLSISAPKLLYAVPLFTIIVVGTFLLAAMFSSLLLLAVTVSDALFVVLYAIYAFAMTALFFGSNFEGTSSFASLYIFFAGLLSLSYRPMVISGIPPLGIPPYDVRTIGELWRQSGTTNPLAQYRNFTIAICWALFAATVVPVFAIPPIRTLRNVLTQNIVTDALTDVQRDLVKLVEALQAEVDKIRGQGDGAVQSTSSAVEMIQSQIVESDKYRMQLVERVQKWNYIHSGGTSQAGLTIFEPLLCGGVIANCELFRSNDHSLRQLHPYPLRYTVPELKILFSETDRLIQSLMLLILLPAEELSQMSTSNSNEDAVVRENTDRPEIAILQLKSANENLSLCTRALANQRSATVREDLDRAVESIKRRRRVRPATSTRLNISGTFSDEDDGDERVSNVEISTASGSTTLTSINTADRNFDHFDYVKLCSDFVVQATANWLDALRGVTTIPPSEEFAVSVGGKSKSRNTPPKKRTATSNFLKIYIPWLAIPLLPLVRFFQAIVEIPLKPKEWRLTPFLWSLKLTAGYVALFAMSVYWKAYADFAIRSTNVAIGGVFSGWQLGAFAFSWTPTVEGTFKKGLQRILGTCLGGFFAWLGIIICSGTIQDGVPINPFGLVVWLTFSMHIAAAIGLDKGIQSWFGADADHGYTATYFGTVLTLVSLEVYLGLGSKGDLVANRLVATVSGVVVALLINLVPPYEIGGDPSHTKRYHESIEKAFDALLNVIVSAEKREDVDGESFTREYIDAMSKQRRFAVFLRNDAHTLRVLPFFQVNERLSVLLDSLVVVESVIQRCVDALVSIPIHSDEDWQAFVSAVKDLRENDQMSQRQPEDAEEVENGGGSQSTRKFQLSSLVIAKAYLKKAGKTLSELPKNDNALASFCQSGRV